VRVEVCVDPEEACRRAAARVARVIRERATRQAGSAAGRAAVLALATGRTMEGVYAELVRLHVEERLSFRGVTTFNLDEYWPMPADDPRSFHAYMGRRLLDHVDLEPARVHLPDGSLPRERLAEACAAYEVSIVRAGGLDLALLGLGLNGHLGYNEPGSAPDSRTRLVTLDSSSRPRATAGEGPAAGPEPPSRALTMGLGTILEARSIVLLAFGAEKAGVVSAALRGPRTVAVPASILQRHPDVLVLLDREAARGIDGAFRV